MLESRPIPGSNYAIDSLGRLQNQNTGSYISPCKSGPYYYYPTPKGRVATLMQEIWPEVAFTEDERWALATKEHLGLNKIITKAREDTARQELAKSDYWGKTTLAPPGLTWKTHSRYPKVEFSETGLLRKKSDLDTAHTPHLSNNFCPIFRKSESGYVQMISLRKVYKELFHKEWSIDRKSTLPMDHEHCFDACPYAQGQIETLYGSGKPDAQFSPLDWYHDQLPEAVMMRAQ